MSAYTYAYQAKWNDSFQTYHANKKVQIALCLSLLFNITLPLAGHTRAIAPVIVKTGYFIPKGMSVKSYAKKNYMAYGASTSQWACLNTLWTRESHWNYKARNPKGGAYGIVQAYPPSKMATVGKDWRTNPAVQIQWGLRYIKARYNFNACYALKHSYRKGWY